MKVHAETERWTLYHGDAADVLSSMPAESVDAVVTDPPYGLGFTYGDWREPSTPTDYWEWFQPHLELMLRVLRPGGLLACWQAQPYLRYVWDWFGSSAHVFVGAKTFVQMRPTPIQWAWDPVVMLYKPGARPLSPAKPERSHDWAIANNAGLIGDRLAPEKAHPNPRPLELVRHIVRNFTLPGGVILDPFAGSGTTLIAAVAEGRRAIGVERYGPYCELASRRLERVVSPLPGLAI